MAAHMEDGSLPLDALQAWPQASALEAERLLRAALRAGSGKIIVLDDDPTGVQTVHGVDVYTHWDQAAIDEGFRGQRRLFYILTNSRALLPRQTEELHRDIALKVLDASRRLGRDFLLISRSDSTLRGHYPLETEALRQALEEAGGLRFDGEIICPFFMEGGRYTLGDVHYVKEGDRLVPAAQTEFARDAAFGYTHSDLKQWVEEKTGGRFPAKDVISIALEDLRALRVDAVAAYLARAENFQKIIVNAASYEDLKVFAAAFARARARGKRYLLRTAAALPRVLGGVKDKPLLGARELASRTGNGGLIIVGSHVQKSTAQLKHLLAAFPELAALEFQAKAAFTDGGLEAETARVRDAAREAIRRGQTAVVYTSRGLLTVPGSGEESLRLSVRIADALTGVVSGLTVRPAFLVAKGGITSSDIGVKGLNVRKARVLGQAAPGVPVWRTDSGSKFGRMPYVIFPGNVGGEDGLTRVVAACLGKEP